MTEYLTNLMILFNVYIGSTLGKSKMINKALGDRIVQKMVQEGVFNDVEVQNASGFSSWILEVGENAPQLETKTLSISISYRRKKGRGGEFDFCVYDMTECFTIFNGI